MHPLVQSYTREEMFIEYWAHALEDNPDADILMEKSLDAKDVQFKTGDEVVDSVEERLAHGEEVDIIKEFCDPDEIEDIKGYLKFVSEKTKIKPESKQVPLPEDGFEDTYPSATEGLPDPEPDDPIDGET